ncbi:MAG TPA: DUF362 domain-containing protein [Dehalococcoidia bacterium]|nr:DUF362 domain-containing protein [Dehalococcoidia bacterium]
MSKIRVETDIQMAIIKALDLIGGLAKLPCRNEQVMVKPNFNSPDPFPGSTDPLFLSAVLQLLLENGAKVVVGESSGGMWRPSRKVARKLGVESLLSKLGVKLILFDDRPRDWVEVKVDGDYIHKVTVPKAAYEADRMVYLPCMKTHSLARFSLSLKLAVGFMHPGERRFLHSGDLEQKAAEVNLVWQPDLIIMDGRKAFVTRGPEKGDLVEPGILMASGDMIAIDVEALKVLASYKARNNLLPDPYASPQIATAMRHGLGARQGQYLVVS